MIVSEFPEYRVQCVVVLSDYPFAFIVRRFVTPCAGETVKADGDTPAINCACRVHLGDPSLGGSVNMRVMTLSGPAHKCAVLMVRRSQRPGMFRMFRCAMPRSDRSVSRSDFVRCGHIQRRQTMEDSRQTR